MDDELKIGQYDLRIKPLVVPDFTQDKEMSPELLAAIRHSNMTEVDKFNLTTSRMIARKMDFLVDAAIQSNANQMYLEHELIQTVKWKNFVWSRASLIVVILGIIAHAYVENLFSHAAK